MEDTTYDNCRAEGNDEKSVVNKKLLLLDSPLTVLRKRDVVLNIGSYIGHLESECESESGQRPSEELVTAAEIVPEATFNGSNGFDDGKSELEPPRRRSSSLKGHRSVPASPGVSKAVHFADAMGLDLAFVKKIINSDEPPIIPKSALVDLHTVPSASEELTSFLVSHRVLSQKFILSTASSDFLEQLSERKVMLESCAADNANLIVLGIVRVANVDYHKSVTVRYTLNNWLTLDELQATYICNSCDGPTDRFSFAVSLPESIEAGMCLQFALKFVAGGMTFWDNNLGSNYVVQCLSSNDRSENC